jgi:hypothetical protein
MLRMTSSGRSSPHRAYIRWSKAAGPFWMYLGLTPLLGATDAQLGALSDAPGLMGTASDLLTRQVYPLLPNDGSAVSLVLDLPLRTSLSAAMSLAKAGFLPVPLVHRWPAAPSNLDASEAANLLVQLAPDRGAGCLSRGIALLLDGERYSGSRPFATSRFDGRYHYPLDVLPPPHALLEHGVSSVITVCDRVDLHADLAAIVDRYSKSGLATAAIWVDTAGAVASAVGGV